MNYSTLVPDIQRRLDTWVQLHENLDKKQAIEKKSTITISREFGCEAYPLALALADALTAKTGETWTIFDNAIIDKLCSMEKYSENFMGTMNSSYQFLDFISNFSAQTAADKANAKVVEYIGKVAQHGNAVIIGRGASIITKELNNCFHFRLVAPLEFRITSIANRMGTSYEEAQKFVMENQKDRDDFLKRHFTTPIENQELYDAIFNNARMSTEKMTKSIIDIVEDEN